MEFLVIIIVALLPAALLWWYIWKKDQKKEPIKWLAKATCYGILICVPVSIVEMIIESILFGPEGNPTTIFEVTVGTGVCHTDVLCKMEEV